jgi:hypothetical protein
MLVVSAAFRGRGEHIMKSKTQRGRWSHESATQAHVHRVTLLRGGKIPKESCDEQAQDI